MPLWRCPRAILLALVAFVAGLSTAAQTNSSAHLLLIDTSSSAGRRKAEILMLVRRAIESGFAGTIEEGEKYSVWTFNSEIAPREFPDQAWSAADAALQAELIGRFLSTKKHGKKADVRAALGAAAQFLQREGNARVFLITDHNASFAGEQLPPLIQFEDFFRAHLKEARKPALTTVNAHNGRIWNWSIDHNTGPLYVPALPEAPKTEAPAVAEKQPEPRLRPQPAPPPLKPPVLTISERLASNVRIVPPAPEVKTNAISAAAAAQALFAQVTNNPAPLPTPAPKGEPPRQPQPEATAPQQPLLPAPQPPAQQIDQTTPPPQTTTAAAPELQTAAALTATTPPPRSVSPPPPILESPVPRPESAPPPLAFKPVQPTPHARAGRAFVVAGAAALLFGLIGLMAILSRRKRRPPGSLISRSLTSSDR